MTDRRHGHGGAAWSGYSSLSSAMDVDLDPCAAPSPSFEAPLHRGSPLRPKTPSASTSGKSWAGHHPSRSSTPQPFSPMSPSTPYAANRAVRIASSSQSPFSSSPIAYASSPAASLPSPFYSSVASSSPEPSATAAWSPESFRSSPSPRSSPASLLSQVYLGRGVGPLVPQRAYQTHFRAGDEPFHIDFRFAGANQLGIPLRLLLDATAMDLPIEGADDVPFMPNISTTITLRICWPGYVQYPRRLTMRKATGVLSRVELAMAIAECYKTFIEEARSDPADGGNDHWRVGRGRITAKDLFLLRLTQVSQGSWQADIALERH